MRSYYLSSSHVLAFVVFCPAFPPLTIPSAYVSIFNYQNLFPYILQITECFFHPQSQTSGSFVIRPSTFPAVSFFSRGSFFSFLTFFFVRHHPTRIGNPSARFSLIEPDYSSFSSCFDGISFLLSLPF